MAEKKEEEEEEEECNSWRQITNTIMQHPKLYVNKFYAFCTWHNNSTKHSLHKIACTVQYQPLWH